MGGNDLCTHRKESAFELSRHDDAPQHDRERRRPSPGSPGQPGGRRLRDFEIRLGVLLSLRSPHRRESACGWCRWHTKNFLRELLSNSSGQRSANYQPASGHRPRVKRRVNNGVLYNPGHPSKTAMVTGAGNRILVGLQVFSRRLGQGPQSNL